MKLSKFEDALEILGDKTPNHLLENMNKARRKQQQQTSGNARNGVHHTKGSGRADGIRDNEERDTEITSDTKYDAAMCYLRGICFAKQNAFDRAKECYMDAVRIDVQCFEAFDQLTKNSLLSPDEEWDFLETLDFDSIVANGTDTSQEAAQFVKMLYTTRLSKYKNPAEFSNAVESLSQHYNLESNPDILLSKAELFFTQCRFKQALAITAAVLERDAYNFSFLPIHLACLHELHRSNDLFLLAHRLADLHPEEPATWLAVGVYYLSINQIAEARRFFSKSSMMNPTFAPAWIGFAHTFALEGEHDQAISAYGTAVRLFQGTHLPRLFLGMQHLQLSNLNLAHEYLTSAQKLCGTDPLVLNELGVVYYHNNHLDASAKFFLDSLSLAADIDSESSAWLATRANLGHVYRRQHRWSLALREFNEVLRQMPTKNHTTMNIVCAKGLVLLEMGRCWESIAAFHEALAVSPQDPVANDLLARALEENAMAQGWGVDGMKGDQEKAEEALEEAMQVKLKHLEWNRRMGRGGRQRGRVIGEEGDGEDGGGKGKGKGRMSEGGDDSTMAMSEDERVE